MKFSDFQTLTNFRLSNRGLEKDVEKKKSAAAAAAHGEWDGDDVGQLESGGVEQAEKLDRAAYLFGRWRRRRPRIDADAASDAASRETIGGETEAR